MFEKFQEAVKNAYLDLKKSNKLDFRRDPPSTGDLKNWCIQCLERGLTKEDETVFKNYFNATQSNKSLKDIIRDFEADKLRSLRNFIVNNGTRRPDWEVVKLLAILVDFKLRPYNRDDWDDKPIIKRPLLQPDFKDDGKQEEKQEENEIEKTTNIFGEERTGKEDSTGPNKQKNDPDPTDQHEITADEEQGDNVIIPTPGPSVDPTAVSAPNPIKGKTFFRNKANYPYGALIIVLIAIVIYSFINKECMCWNGIKYIKVDCRDKTQPNQIIALNEDKLHNFEKIMKPDTLSKADVGKVWYSKIDNEVEFFTHSGYHPVNSKKSLKAATEHIINTWAGGKSLNLDNKSIEALP
jgi:hypothetical protein